jgi:hypothetical protein
VEVGTLRETPDMAKKAKKEPAKKEPAKKEPAKKEPAKKEPAKKAAAPAARKEPASDAHIIVNGIAEIVRLGLGAMDPEERATLLVAIGKVGASLPKNR